MVAFSTTTSVAVTLDAPLAAVGVAVDEGSAGIAAVPPSAGEAVEPPEGLLSEADSVVVGLVDSGVAALAAAPAADVT